MWFYRTLGLLLLLVSLWGRAESPVLVISTNNTPLDQKALQEISREAFRRIGYDIKLINLPSERSLQNANKGEVDGEGLRIAGLNQNFPNLVQVPERYISISFVAFAKDALINLDKGWESLKPYRVAFITGWKMFEAHASSTRIVHKVEKPEQMFSMLDNGRIDLALYTLADGLALVRQQKLSSIAPLAPSLKEVDMYLYLHKKHEALVPKLAQALRDIKADGTYHKILFAVTFE
jgi:polar amino acid transport system substrate-binding protein